MGYFFGIIFYVGILGIVFCIGESLRNDDYFFAQHFCVGNRVFGTDDLREVF